MKISKTAPLLVLFFTFFALYSQSFANNWLDSNHNSVDDRTEELLNLIYDDKDTLLVIYQVQRAFSASFATAHYLFDRRYQSILNPADLENSINNIANQIAQNSQDFAAFTANVTLMANSLKCLDYLAIKKTMNPDSNRFLAIKKSARAESLDKDALLTNRTYAQYMNLLSKSPTLSPVVNQIYQNVQNESSNEFCNNILIGKSYNVRKLN